MYPRTPMGGYNGTQNGIGSNGGTTATQEAPNPDTGEPDGNYGIPPIPTHNPNAQMGDLQQNMAQMGQADTNQTTSNGQQKMPTSEEYMKRVRRAWIIYGLSVLASFAGGVVAGYFIFRDR